MMIPSSHMLQVSVMVASSSSRSETSSTSMHEPLVYLVGCLKNISNDSGNQKGERLSREGALVNLSFSLNDGKRLSSSPLRLQAWSSSAGCKFYRHCSHRWRGRWVRAHHVKETHPSSLAACVSSSPGRPTTFRPAAGEPRPAWQAAQGRQRQRPRGRRLYHLGPGTAGAAAPLPTVPCCAPILPPLQVAVQVTGVMRNLAVSPAHAGAFVLSGAIRSLRVMASALVPPPPSVNSVTPPPTM